MKDAILTPHAKFELKRRGLSEEVVRGVLKGPEQSEPVREGRWVYQSRVSMGSPPKTFLIRVIVDVEPSPPEIVTAYRTSKIAKYWREQE